jgi:putative endonuclease
MADPRHRLGRVAEDAVATWLERSGWIILARRHRRGSGGEVDLITLDPGHVLVGIEVRARRSPRAGMPEETIDARRVRRIAGTLLGYARDEGVRHAGLRIDLVAAQPIRRADGALRLRRIPDVGSA